MYYVTFQIHEIFQPVISYYFVLFLDSFLNTFASYTKPLYLNSLYNSTILHHLLYIADSSPLLLWCPLIHVQLSDTYMLKGNLNPHPLHLILLTLPLCHVSDWIKLSDLQHYTRRLWYYWTFWYSCSLFMYANYKNQKYVTEKFIIKKFEHFFRLGFVRFGYLEM